MITIPINKIRLALERHFTWLEANQNGQVSLDETYYWKVGIAKLTKIENPVDPFADVEMGNAFDDVEGLLWSLLSNDDYPGISQLAIIADVLKVMAVKVANDCRSFEGE
jgi:hypothetical protein